ncbi:MAG: FadR/GntR family transcriptional regulator [Acidimicrobiales bacterium]
MEPTATTDGIRSPRLAELIADELRKRILSGDHADGTLMTTYDDISAEFQVSLPSTREALRMLEAEGLVSVRRGKRGGVVVQLPRPENVAYGIGLVLESKGTDVSDLAMALRLLEPVCAAACAARPDRDTAVVPHLRRLLDLSIEVIDDAGEFARHARAFHEQVVHRCGNESTRLIVGALESLWGAQVRGADQLGTFPDRHHRERSVDDHARLINCIADGDPTAAEIAAREHLSRPERPVVLQHPTPVRARRLRPK